MTSVTPVMLTVRGYAGGYLVTGGPITNIVAPVINGSATVGNTLTATTGTWSVTPDSYTYVWKRGGTPIIGATSQTYLLDTADIGQQITCTVTAIKIGNQPGSITTTAVEPTSGIATLTVTDNGDGTFTATGPAVTDNGDGTFTANDPAVTDNGDGTFTLAA